MQYRIIIIFLGLGIQALSQEIKPRYTLVKMGDNVNTRYSEVSPVISPDSKTLYFVVENHPENTYGKENTQDIWITKLDDKGEWTKAKHLGSPYNQNRYNQVFNFLPDGSILIRGGRSKNSAGFSIIRPSGSTSSLEVTDFEKMNLGKYYGATISADGKQMIIYFSEKANDKYSDLYLSSLQPDGHWSRPVKLSISSPADDYSPFLAPDQKTLYFASNRFTKERIGMADLYKSTRLDDSWSHWSEPVNLGKAINTISEDAYFSIDSNGNIFTARAGAFIDGGNFDLLILKPRDIKITMTGVAYNEITKETISGVTIGIKITDQKPINIISGVAGKFQSPLPEVSAYEVDASFKGFMTFQQQYTMPRMNNDSTLVNDIYLTPLDQPKSLAGDITDKKTNVKVAVTNLEIIKKDGAVKFQITTTDGSYKQEINGASWYLLGVTAEGFINYSDSIQIAIGDKGIIRKDIILTPIEVGMTVRLKNIYFDFDRSSLKKESFNELNKVVEFLKQNQAVAIEISGHTDSKGSDEYNLTLSQGRSQSVVDYMISQGISSGRLQAHGYGETKPIDSNETEEGRANNRRVEFTILKIN